MSELMSFHKEPLRNQAAVSHHDLWTARLRMVATLRWYAESNIQFLDAHLATFKLRYPNETLTIQTAYIGDLVMENLGQVFVNAVENDQSPVVRNRWIEITIKLAILNEATRELVNRWQVQVGAGAALRRLQAKPLITKYCEQ